MDKIILGLLLIKNLTIYELRNIIDTNFTSMCSNSTGSIQAALKKLLGQNMVNCDEFVENSINKKVYTLTDTGKEYFLAWVQTSMLAGKKKDMELCKLFFMGFVPAQKRLSLIDSYLDDLKKEKEKLENIKNLDIDAEKLRQITYMEDNNEMLKRFLKATGHTSVQDGIDEVASFELLTLQLGIDRTDFEIEWFERLKAKLSPETS